MKGSEEPDGEVISSVPTDSGVYYTSHYWNDLPRVVAYISENCTGDPTKSWQSDFLERFCPDGPFAHGLFANCGNGWAERDFIDRGIVRKATAFDYAHDLLDQAERERGDRDITYFQADANRVDLGTDLYDLVVNVGALHHVQYINRMAAQLCRAMVEGGTLVSYDYVGPGRNQYSRAHWRQVRAANRALPAPLRKDRLRQPHLPTMLVSDPTEAIHADLVLDSLSRFFTMTEVHQAGGGIAYELLTHNPKFFGEVPDGEVAAELDVILAQDRRLGAAGKVPSLFAYYIARPNKAALGDASLDVFQAAEDARERWAARHRGTYTFAQYFQVQANRAFFAGLRWLPPRLHRWGLRLGERLSERFGL
ncbi:MAG TPA: class I SAM-dependent methyltransferase [Candidatus Nitrosotalea sp.]|nr:class I SAM-dependent methyltransferase [Candidatus Nitrosotalea sp.]